MNATRSLKIFFPPIPDPKIHKQILHYAINGERRESRIFNTSDDGYQLALEVGATFEGCLQYAGLDEGGGDLISDPSNTLQFTVTAKGGLPKPGDMYVKYLD